MASILGALLGLLSTSSFAQNPSTQEAQEQKLRQAVALHSSALADMEGLNFGRAARSLEELEKLLPGNILPKVNLAICRYRLNQTERARQTIQEALQLNGDNLQALFALARILGDRIGDDVEARRTWDRILRRMVTLSAGDPRPYFLRGRSLQDRDRWSDASTVLAEAVRRNPDNLVLLVDLLVNTTLAGDLQGSADALDGIEDRLNGFDEQQAEYADALRDALFDENVAALRPPAQVLQNLLRPTELYQVGLAELQGREGGLFLFPQLDFDPPLPKSIQGGADLEITFEAAVLAPWNGLSDVTSLLIERRLGDEPILVQRKDGALLRATDGNLVDTGLRSSGPFLAFDMDQDEATDLVSSDASGARLHSSFGTTALPLSSQGLGPGDFLLATDAEQDGDLDLLIARRAGSVEVLRNNGGGGFSDVSQDFGLGDGVLLAAAPVDLDEDGDLDLVTSATSGGLRVFINRRSGPLVDATAAWGLESQPAATALLVLDLEGDGDFDLVATGEPTRVLRNQAGRFEVETSELAVSSAVLADLDNDGDLDLSGLSARGELTLIRNQGGDLVKMAAALPQTNASLRQVVPHDVDDDGDLDLLTVRSNGTVGAWMNQGGNRNHWVRLSLKGRNDSNAKNNTQGLFARIELRIGGEFRAHIGNGGVNHLGLGSRRQADVIRVVWTNGLTQTWQQVAAEQTLLEEQVLKGSCPFLYTWNGTGFTFHTDLMWRSTLGMKFADGSAAPHQSARDYVLIPEHSLRPSGNELWLQVTDELWETIYIDQQQLLVVDVPGGTELIVDESFGPPPFPEAPPLLLADQLTAPVAARDHKGRDVLELITDRDGERVADLPRTRFQGVTELHSLELDFPPAHEPASPPTHLVLWGWIFPADTTINVALAQDPTRSPEPPWIELLSEGNEVIEKLPLPFPNGKRKAVVVALPRSEKMSEALGSGLRMILRSNNELYWDRAALATESSAAPKLTALRPIAADLHYRGYSRMRPRQHAEPHLFDYDAATVQTIFAPMTGRHTRYGNVLPLVLEGDDRLVIMSPGDEMTLRYPLPAVPAPGARRAYVLFTDGWVKDADLHTTASETVGPLPYHGMSSYPDQPHRPPRTESHLSDDREYHTRWLTGRHPQR